MFGGWGVGRGGTRATQQQRSETGRPLRRVNGLLSTWHAAFHTVEYESSIEFQLASHD